ncbi:MAG: hypothetical protein GWP10_15900 [Nitrospiraceae bacterium]|nr:hypothetical protein [Nitrospiraceae bacterium]
MILNTLLHGIVAAILCVFFFFVAWGAVHENKNDRAVLLIAVCLTLFGVVLGLAAIEWLSAGL